MEPRYKETKAGTKLPLMDLKGKDYLQVAWRLVWLREEHLDWVIKTEFVKLDEKGCLCKATVEDNNGSIKGWAHKYEHNKAFYIEKAETGAIGRVLATLGYGTQFEPSLDEGEDVVDTPLELEKTIDLSDVRIVQVKGEKNEQRENNKNSDRKDYKIDAVNGNGIQHPEVSPTRPSKLINHAPKTKEELKGITQDQLTKLRDWSIKTEQKPEELAKVLKEITGVDKSIMLNQAQYRAFCEHLGIQP